VTPGHLWAYGYLIDIIKDLLDKCDPRASLGLWLFK
jgi:hypothetical protein